MPARSPDRPRPAAVDAGGAPVLVDPDRGVTLRPLTEADLAAVVEQCRDPETVRWTSVPDPYETSDAHAFLDAVALGWASGRRCNWVVEADRDGHRAYCGSIELRLDDQGGAETGFVLHPAARGRGLMSSALRLVRDHAFERLGLRLLRWRAPVGHWSSRRVAAAAGFRFDGTVRALLTLRGEPVDGWVATVLATDEPADLGWSDPPRIVGGRVVLRPFVDTDLPRVVEGNADPRTRQWLVSIPAPYGLAEATAYVEGIRAEVALGVAYAWCIADRADDRCLGGVSLDGFGGYHRRSEIGYWTHPDARGRGLVTEAVRLLTAYAEETWSVDSLMIRCAGGNTASRHVARSAGYREIGVQTASEPLGDGTLDDLVLYARP